jgi:hypothetical protein
MNDEIGKKAARVTSEADRDHCRRRPDEVDQFQTRELPCHRKSAKFPQFYRYTDMVLAGYRKLVIEVSWWGGGVEIQENRGQN